MRLHHHVLCAIFAASLIVVVRGSTETASALPPGCTGDDDCYWQEIGKVCPACQPCQMGFCVWPLRCESSDWQKGSCIFYEQLVCTNACTAGQTRQSIGMAACGTCY